MNILALIPARGGSKGIPRKNIRMFNGRPLIAYTIDAAKASKYVSRVHVNTEDKEIALVARECGAEVPFLRPSELARDTSKVADAVIDHLDRLNALGEPDPTHLMLLQATSPMRRPEDIDRAVELFLERGADSLASVCRTESALMMKDGASDELTILPNEHDTSFNRQENPKFYKFDGSMIYIIKTSVLRRERSFLAGKLVGFEIERWRGVDLDEPEDFAAGQVIHANRHEIERGIAEMARSDAPASPAPPKHIQIGQRRIGPAERPFVIVEIGINHGGSVDKAKRMIDDARAAGAECVKFQCHVIEDEMVPIAKNIIPSHTTESIWDIMKQCALNEEQERELKAYVESKGMIYMSTPFSRAAADRLERMGVVAYKIGSGECNNYPLIEHIASFGKPVILSTGMNDIASIAPAVGILRAKGIPFALMHCVSMYPTPYGKVRLGSIEDLQKAFPDAVTGLSDHSMGIYTCLGAVALGASILEKHFTSTKAWEGADIAISITPSELEEMVRGSAAIHQALGGRKEILKEEQPVIDFAYACVVTIRPIAQGETFTRDNIWVKRPGTGEIKAVQFNELLGRRAAESLPADIQLMRRHVGP
jgi:sialic acid synthase SpsE/CMP-N-acetylneuraminic acid synthetase